MLTITHSTIYTYSSCFDTRAVDLISGLTFISHPQQHFSAASKIAQSVRPAILDLHESGTIG
jgi:hypothetical protein